MDDSQKALDFNNQLDGFLNNKFTDAAEDRDLLGVAQALSTADFSHESRIRQPLYARLRATAYARASRPAHWQRRLLTTAFSVIITAAVIFTVPPLRALAQEVIKRLQTLTLTNAPSYVETFLTATPTIDPANPPVYQMDLPLQQAIAKAGFTPLLPTYMPEGYSLEGYRSNDGQFTASFQPSNMTYERCCAVLSLTQIRNPPSDSAPFPMGDVPIEDVTVRGVPGLWVEDSHTGMTPDEKGELQIMPTSILTWEADGYLFWMSSYDSQTNQPLSKAEMMQVANALQPATNE
ncbi:MAG: hypothetical protein LCI00_21275 [Chloroflexi bacterium]|nr:hypothetical protein [Chloroflexota bacterium]MCC6892358.1 hypothetical protein [Anaerolineae bacterium]